MIAKLFYCMVLIFMFSGLVFAQANDFSDWVDPNYDYSCTACGGHSLGKNMSAPSSITEIVIIAVDSGADSQLPT